MAYVVTAPHPISLPGGSMAGPGEEVKNVKATDPHIAALVDAGSLTKKRTPKPKPTKSAETEEAIPSPEPSNETEQK